MNTETGQIYRGEAAVEEARKRGEPLVELTEDQANHLEGLNREQRREEARRMGLFKKNGRR
jgi:hypothetical protein